MGDLFGLSGMADAAGQIAGAHIQAGAQEQTNATNIQLARENTAFQERMSNTAYQRSTEDMQKAGINPALAYMKGGASSPTGTTAHVDAPQYGKTAQAIASSAFQAKATAQALNDKQADINLKNTMAVTETAKAQKEASNAKTAEVETEVAKAELPRVKAEAETRKGQAEWDKWSQGWDHVSGRVFEAISNSGKAIGNFGKGLFRGNPTDGGPGPYKGGSIHKHKELHKAWNQGK